MSTTSHFDTIILGQGLAGTAVAWSLRWSGQRVLIIDREAPVTSSKIAAGLVTPITGQKLTVTWRHAELWPAAVSFYRRVEAEMGRAVFRERPMVRLLASDLEVATYKRRRGQTEFAELIQPAEPHLNDEWFEAPHGCFQMAPAGQLDVPAYLRVSRDAFDAIGGYLACDVDLASDIELTSNGVRFPRLAVTADRLIFCQGYDAIDNPWFRDVAFKPAKGEILTLRVPGLHENRVIHQAVWLAPAGDDLYKAGSTYAWKQLDSCPTPQGRDEIVRDLRRFLRRPFEITGHEAAVRPIHRNQYPVLGIHPVHPQLAYLNGLGSKGTVHAPYFAMQLAKALLSGGRIDPEVDLSLKASKSSLPGGGKRSVAEMGIGTSQCHVKRDEAGTARAASMESAKPRRQTRRPLTEQAQDAIRAILRAGDVTIDATAGNGHDTQFLAKCIGPSGVVYAFDIQPEALDRTGKRLADAGLTNVVLLNCDHCRLSNQIPIQHHGHVAAVMFNLGYLPGGDKSVVTDLDSTVSAIRQSMLLLRAGGMLSVLAYTGHDGGQAEADVVANFLSRLPTKEFALTTIESQPGRTAGPRLFLVKRIDG